MRITFFSRCLILGLLVATMSVLPAQQPAAVLVNAELLDKDGDGLPDGWHPLPPANNTTTRLSLNKDANEIALHISDKDPAAGVGVCQWIPCRSGHRYTFSAEVKGGAISLYLNPCDSRQRLVGMEQATTTTASMDWRRCGISVTVPPGATQLQVRIYSTTADITDVLVRNPELRDTVDAKRTAPITTDAEFFSAINLEYPGLQAVNNAVTAGDLAAAKVAYLAYRRTKSQVRWSPTGMADALVSEPASRPAHAVAATDSAAELAMQHRINMPSGEDKQYYFVGDDIDWSFNPNKPDDPAFTSEWTYSFNRLYFWNDLANGYWKTLDEKYAREWVAQMQSWVRKNPVPLDAGPGDTLDWRTIEAGIRMGQTWPNAYFHFLHSPSFTPDVHADYVKSALEHARRLQRVLREYPNHGGNWVTMECHGLGSVGILFPELKEASGFLKAAVNRLNTELTVQVYPDGGQVELSTNYHQIARESFAGLAKLARLNYLQLPRTYMANLKMMYCWNMALADQSGFVPPFNDAAPSMNVRASLQEADALWPVLWGTREFRFSATLGKEGKAPPLSTALSYSGYDVMRSGWRTNDLYLAFDNGPAGAGHWHEDMLNLYLRDFGTVLLTEAGGYVYDQSPWRRYVISTPAHNCITVDDKEQHRGGLEKVPPMKQVKGPWLTSPLYDHAGGTYDAGYQAQEYVAREAMPLNYMGAVEKSISHTRHVIFLKPYYILIVDLLQGAGEHRYDAYFHLDAPDAAADDKSGQVWTRRTDDKQLLLMPFDNQDNLQVKIAKGQMDPILGWIPSQQRPIPTVVYTKQGEAPVSFSTLLYPYQGEKPVVTARPLLSDMPRYWARQFETPYEQAVVAIRRYATDTAPAKFATDHFPLITTNAGVLVVRRRKNAADVTWIGLENVTTFDDGKLKFYTDVPAGVLFTYDAATGKLTIGNSTTRAVKVTVTRPFTRVVTLGAGGWDRLSAKGYTPFFSPPAVFR